MLGSIALGVGAVVTGGLGYMAKASAVSFNRETDDIENSEIVPIRHAFQAMRGHRGDKGGVVTGRFSCEGYSWAPRGDTVFRDSGSEDPHRFALLRTDEVELVEETDVVKRKEVDAEGHQTITEKKVRRQKENQLSSVVKGRALCLIDRTSFERTGLDIAGAGHVPDSELERRREVISTFSYDELDLLEPEAQEQAAQEIEDRGFFMNLIPSLGDKIYGKKKSKDDIIGPLFWADPNEERPNDPIEKRAGGVWLEVPRDLVPKELFMETSASVQPGTASFQAHVSSGGSSEPPAPRVIGLKTSEAGIPFGLPLFVHGTMALDSSGRLVAAQPAVVTNLSKEEYVLSCRKSAATVDLVGTSLFGISGALAAGAVVTAVRAINQAPKV